MLDKETITVILSDQLRQWNEEQAADPVFSAEYDPYYDGARAALQRLADGLGVTLTEK